MRLLLIISIAISLMFAKSDKLSHIPPTKSVFLNIDGAICDVYCMEKYIDDGQIFSFLSHYNNSMAELQTMQSEYEYYKRIFRIFDDEFMSIRVALLVPQKSIRRYAITTVNSTIAYLMSKQNDFEVKVFNSIDESEESVKKQFEEIKKENFMYVIAPVTEVGAKSIVKYVDDLIVYIPTVHKSNIESNKSNIIFGGINYDKQIEELLKFSNDKVSYFTDGSNLSNSLNKSLTNLHPSIVYSKNINNSRVNFKRILKNNRRIKGTTVFMNTPLVKTSLISSQLRVYKIEPYSILSTQINYNPMLLTLTQYEDRKNFLIANSIGNTIVTMKEINSLFGHDIVYDWVNYSTSIGIDFLYTNYFVPVSQKNFSENIVENQVQYDISIVKPRRYKFEKELF